MKESVKILGIGAALVGAAVYLFRDKVEETVYNNLSLAFKKFRIKGFNLGALGVNVETDWAITNKNAIGATLYSFAGSVTANYNQTNSFLTNANINQAVVVPAGGTVVGTVKSTISALELLDDIQLLIQGQKLTSGLIAGTANTSLGSFQVSKPINVVYA